MSGVNVIRDGEARLVQVVVNGETQLVRVVGDGPSQLVRIVSEGPQGPAGPGAMTDLVDVDVANVNNRSMLIYDSAQGKWIGDAGTTVDEVLNGGNF